MAEVKPVTGRHGAPATGIVNVMGGARGHMWILSVDLSGSIPGSENILQEVICMTPPTKNELGQYVMSLFSVVRSSFIVYTIDSIGG